MLPTATLVATVAALSQLVAGVDFWAHSQEWCNGPAVACLNIGSNVCCHGAPRTYQSSRCIASSPSGIRHYLYIPFPNGDQGCGTDAYRGPCQGNCINLRNLSGLRWNRPGRKRSDEAGIERIEEEEEEEVEDCIGSVEPDLMQLDGRTFSLNDTAMTQEQRDSMWSYYDERVEAAKNVDGDFTVTLTEISAEFDAFEVDLE